MLLAVTGAYLLTIRRWIVGWIMLAAGLCLVILDLTGIHVSFAKIYFSVGPHFRRSSYHIKYQ